MNRLLTGWLLVMLAMPACQCFEPVGELEQDAGVDAGRSVADAGVDAGQGVDAGTSRDGGEECLTAADCTAAPWAACLFLGQTPALSCVSQRCVSECLGGDAGRTCDYRPNGECMTCDAEAPLCNADTCETNAFTATVSIVGCRPGVTASLAIGTTLIFVPVRGASCELSVSTNEGGLGQVIRARNGVGHYWFIRALGGWCVGEQLPTGALRSTVACPACTFGIEGF